MVGRRPPLRAGTSVSLLSGGPVFSRAGESRPHSAQPPSDSLARSAQWPQPAVDNDSFANTTWAPTPASEVASILRQVRFCTWS